MKKVRYRDTTILASIVWIIVLVYFIFFPLNGTTWEYLERAGNGHRRHTLSYGIWKVTYTVYNVGGSQSENPISGRYKLRGNMLTEIYRDSYGDISREYSYYGTIIVSSENPNFIYTRLLKDQ